LSPVSEARTLTATTEKCSLLATGPSFKAALYVDSATQYKLESFANACEWCSCIAPHCTLTCYWTTFDYMQGSVGTLANTPLLIEKGTLV